MRGDRPVVINKPTFDRVRMRRRLKIRAINSGGENKSAFLQQQKYLTACFQFVTFIFDLSLEVFAINPVTL